MDLLVFFIFFDEVFFFPLRKIFGLNEFPIMRIEFQFLINFNNLFILENRRNNVILNTVLGFS